jgi:hypothetical protein
MTLATIALAFQNFAQAELKNAENDALETLAKGVTDVGEGLETLVEQTGAAATKLVTDLMNDPSLSGLEKANLAATSLVEMYALKGIQIAEVDATFIIKGAYITAAEYLRSLKS